MLGYYKIDKDLIKNIGIKCQNIEENIYHLCCPLIVENKKSLPSNLRYLYELLEIPIIPYSKFNKDRIEENKELEQTVDELKNKFGISIIKKASLLEQKIDKKYLN